MTMKKFFISATMILLLIIVVLFIFGISNIDTILHEPKQTSEEFLDTVPYININLFSKDIIVTQPSSSIIVFAVGFASLFAGIILLFKGKKQKSRSWCALAFINLGFAALFAGISYQAFTYQIKCAGREYCVWTSWWEIVYLIFTVMGMSSIMVAQSYFTSNNKVKKTMRVYPLISVFCYLVIILIGIMLPIKFLISFEFLVAFLLPNCLVFALLTVLDYIKTKRKIYLHFLIGGGIFLFSVLVYFVYMQLHISEILWSRGIWFNENDILHSILFVCIIYITIFVLKHIRDFQIKI